MAARGRRDRLVGLFAISRPVIFTGITAANVRFPVELSSRCESRQSETKQSQRLLAWPVVCVRFGLAVDRGVQSSRVDENGICETHNHLTVVAGY